MKTFSDEQKWDDLDQKHGNLQEFKVKGDMFSIEKSKNAIIFSQLGKMQELLAKSEKVLIEAREKQNFQAWRKWGKKRNLARNKRFKFKQRKRKHFSIKVKKFPV